MNDEQQKMQEYILERTHEHKTDDQKEVLANNFDVLLKNDPDKDESIITKINEKILENVKPEYIEDVTALLNGFASNF